MKRFSNNLSSSQGQLMEDQIIGQWVCLPSLLITEGLFVASQGSGEVEVAPIPLRSLTRPPTFPSGHSWGSHLWYCDQYHHHQHHQRDHHSQLDILRRRLKAWGANMRSSLITFLSTISNKFFFFFRVIVCQSGWRGHSWKIHHWQVIKKLPIHPIQLLLYENNISIIATQQ